MWQYFLANYATFGFIVLGVLIIVKLLLTLFFQNYERNVVGIVSAIFKWYGIIDRDLAENSLERFSMYLQNIASIFIGIIAALLLFMKFLFV